MLSPVHLAHVGSATGRSTGESSQEAALYPLHYYTSKMGGGETGQDGAQLGFSNLFFLTIWWGIHLNVTPIITVNHHNATLSSRVSGGFHLCMTCIPLCCPSGALTAPRFPRAEGRARRLVHSETHRTFLAPHSTYSTAMTPCTGNA